MPLVGFKTSPVEPVVEAVPHTLVYWDEKRGLIVSPSHGLPSPFAIVGRTDIFGDNDQVVTVRIDFERVEP